MKGTERPKVFISYSWSGPEHEKWVVDLAERLSLDGVNVILDKWDLKEGQDKHKFMEQMVADSEIGKVLVICDRSYEEKANTRKGGVGTESLLISKEVYENTDQEKFIPVIKEVDEKGNPAVPHYMSGRIFIDLSKEAVYEENYQRLVRNIYGKPLFKRPTLGVPPSYILNENHPSLITAHKVEEIKRAFLSGRSADALIGDYVEKFFESLESLDIKNEEGNEVDEKLLKSIEKSIPLREDFIDFILVTFKFGGPQVDLEIFKDFVERLIKTETRGSGQNDDNYKFFAYEFALYFFSTLLKLKKFKEAAYLIHSNYLLKHPGNGDFLYHKIIILNRYISSLDETRNKRLELNRISITADLIKSRATRTDITFEDLMETDALLYYISQINKFEFQWFPRINVYRNDVRLEVIARMESFDFFEKVKCLLGVNNKDDLFEKINSYVLEREEKELREPYYGDYRIRPIEDVFNEEKIGVIS